MFVLLNTLWFVWMLKYVLFWLYLWQLKEYHVGRLFDHFTTHKGKKILFSYEQIFKILILISFLSDSNLFSASLVVLILVYFVELLIFLRGIYLKSFKKPVITLKTIFLTAVSFAVVILFLVWTLKLVDTAQPVWLLAFDILTPLIISVIVLLFQPFFVLLRNNTLAKAGEKLKKYKNLKVIAITGSYGKTSTKEFLTTILSKKFKVLSTKAHQNAEIGVAKCILEDLKPEHQIFIAEVGAYNKGKVKEVCNMLKPKIGIVTGVNQQHMSLFGSLENLLSAEGGGELADALPKDGLLIVNGDNKYCLDLYRNTHKNKKAYSVNKGKINSDIWADSVTASKDSISFIALDKTGQMAHFYVRVLGKHNVQNLLGAILIAKELGMSFGEIAEACKEIKQDQAGMILKQGNHGLEVIDSSYSANPDGVFADLDYLNVFGGKKVVVMPCLIELGEKSGEIHEKIGKKIAQVCDLAIITSKDKFAELKKGAIDAGMPEKNIKLIEPPHEIYSAITLFCKSGDAFLLEGRVPKELINLLTK